MTNHTETIPETIHDKVKNLVAEVVDAIDTDAIGSSVEEIESKHVSGFIPFTDGGWDGVVTFGLLDHGWDFGGKIRASVERDQDEMLAQFIADQGLPETTTWDDLSENPEWDDFRTEWEQSDPATFFVKVRALFYRAHHHRNVSGRDEYLICIGLNDDYNYGRDSIGWCPGVGTTWTWETNLPVDEITPERLAEIKATMLAVWQAS